MKSWFIILLLLLGPVAAAAVDLTTTTLGEFTLEDGGKSVFCTMILTSDSYDPHSIGAGEQANIEIVCNGDYKVHIETHLDHEGLCDYVDTGTVCTGIGTFTCRYKTSAAGLPSLFYDDPDSPCEGHENAFRPRDICTKAHMVAYEGGGPDFWAFGDCDIDLLTEDLFTYEIPELITYVDTIYTYVPFPTFAWANPFYGTSSIEIDIDCDRSTPYSECEDNAYFSPDIIITSSELINAGYDLHNINGYPVNIIVDDSYDCVGEGDCGISMRVYDMNGNYRFDSFHLPIQESLSCEEQSGNCCQEGFGCGGQEIDNTECNCCIGACVPTCDTLGGVCCASGYGCIGNEISGSSCNGDCCEDQQDCLPRCDTLGGHLCTSPQVCEGELADTYDHGQGGSAACCVGTCTTPDVACNELPESICCPDPHVCYGAGSPVSYATGCGEGNTCYSDCTSQACVTEELICDNANPSLSPCDSSSQGSQECGGYDTLCMCRDGNWETYQYCEEGCMVETGLTFEGPQSAALKNEKGDRSMHFCALPLMLPDCIESDGGKSDLKVKASCFGKNNVLTHDQCTPGQGEVIEYHCGTDDLCHADPPAACPGSSICVDGRCVLGGCPAELPISSSTDVICKIAYDRSAGKLDHKKTQSEPIIEICEPTIFNFVKGTIYQDDSVGADAVQGNFDQAIQRLWTIVEPLYSGQPPLAPPGQEERCGQGFAHTPSELLAGGKFGECFEWSNLWLTLSRTMGVPTERGFIASYLFKPSGVNLGGVLPAAHAVYAYKNDAGPDWTIIDTTYAKENFNSNIWDTKISACNIARCFYQNDFLPEHEWTDADSFNYGCSLSPHCAEPCFDGTPRTQCSPMEPWYCTSEGKLITDNASACGCPADPHFFHVVSGASDFCACDTPNTCLPNADSHPYFCSDTLIGPWAGRDIYRLKRDCRGADGVVGGVDCPCPTGTTCGNSGWCEVT
ncbi:MAG: hypothetical protein ABIH34_04010 [Nanoarchaeota archaeon]